MKTLGERKVAVISAMVPPEHSGAGLAALQYSRRLEARGSLCFLMTASERPAGEWALDDSQLMQVLQERTYFVGRGMAGRKWSWPRVLREHVNRFFGTIRRLCLERERYDIVHCFSPTWFSLFAALGGKLTGKKLIVEITLLGGDCPESVASHRWSIFHYRRTVQFRMADAIICISPALKAASLRAGLPEGKLFVIPRAVNLEKFRPPVAGEKERLRERLGLPANMTLILFVGGICLRKGIDLLLPAFKEIAVKDPNVGLVIVGPSYKSAEAVQWHERILEARKDPVWGSRIFYPGWQTNVAEYMRAADVFSLPSRREGFGNVFAEAVATGLPVVCLRLEGITDFILTERPVGYLVEEQTPEALAEAIASAVQSSRIEGEKISRAARQIAESRFSPEKIDAAYQEVYDRLLSARD